MNRDLPIEKKLQLLRLGLKQELKSLNSLGYDFIGEDVFKTKLTNVSYLFDFRNDKADREISFHYIPADERSGDCLVVNIKNGHKDRFALNDYFTAHKLMKEAEEVRNVRRQTEDFSQWLSNKLTLIDRIFLYGLQDVLSGREWEKVPMDWQRYK